jgi:hypothetical protein
VKKKWHIKRPTEAQKRLLDIMRATGQSLCMEFVDDTLSFFLSSGSPVHPKVAQNIIAKDYLRSNEDGIFEGATPQSYSLNKQGDGNAA